MRTSHANEFFILCQLISALHCRKGHQSYWLYCIYSLSKLYVWHLPLRASRSPINDPVTSRVSGSASESGGHTPGGRPRRDRKVPLKLQDPLMVSPVSGATTAGKKQSPAAATAGKRKGGVKLMVKVGNRPHRWRFWGCV